MERGRRGTLSSRKSEPSRDRHGAEGHQEQEPQPSSQTQLQPQQIDEQQLVEYQHDQQFVEYQQGGDELHWLNQQIYPLSYLQPPWDYQLASQPVAESSVLSHAQSNFFVDSSAGVDVPYGSVRDEPYPDPRMAGRETRASDEATTKSKKIQFISHDPTQQNKRRRTNTACSTCQRRRVRCSGERPECQTCSNSGRNCPGYRSPPQPPPPPQQPRAASTTSAQLSSPQSWFSAPSLGSPIVPPGSTTGTTKYPVQEGSATSRGRIDTGRDSLPYLRYIGPTIDDSSKQPSTWLEAETLNTSVPTRTNVPGLPLRKTRVQHAMERFPEAEVRKDFPARIQLYDRSDTLPVPPLISHLCELFFIHLGCIFPFLQRDRFLQGMRVKEVDEILVDAMCAVAARFSAHPSLLTPSSDKTPVNAENEVLRGFRGYPFALRVREALTGALPKPTIVLAQACLILAFDECRTKDFVAASIYSAMVSRMVQIQGLQNVQAPELASQARAAPGLSGGKPAHERRPDHEQPPSAAEEQFRQASSTDDSAEQEAARIDTICSVILLDRLISLTTQHQFALQDRNFDVPYIVQWAAGGACSARRPLSLLLRIVLLQCQLLEKLDRIGQTAMDAREFRSYLETFAQKLKEIYQVLGSSLELGMRNFCQHAKANLGTPFILLHLWFHAGIVLLNRPFLFQFRLSQRGVAGFGAREPALSSAKTIIDTTNFAHMIDPKSFLSSPFLSQPIFVAACSFLHEMGSESGGKQSSTIEESSGGPISPHVVVAARNFLRCRSALRSLEDYWHATSFLIKKMDERAAPVHNLLLSIMKEDTTQSHPENTATSRSWRGQPPSRSMTLEAVMGPRSGRSGAFGPVEKKRPGSVIDPKEAIGWCLSGSLRPSTFTLGFFGQEAWKRSGTAQAIIGDPTAQPQATLSTSLLSPARKTRPHESIDASIPFSADLSATSSANIAGTSSVTADANLLLGLHSPEHSRDPRSSDMGATTLQQPTDVLAGLIGTLVLESEEVDMASTIPDPASPNRMALPWLEDLPPELLTYWDGPKGLPATTHPVDPVPPLRP